MKKVLNIAVIALLLTGCAANEKRTSDPLEFPFDRQLSNTEPYRLMTTPLSADQTTRDVAETKQKDQPVIFKGNDRQIKLPSVRPPIKLFGEAVALNFEQAPLVDVVHAILGDMLGLDYVIEHPIAGEVTLRTRTPVPRDQLLVILESLLRSNNAVMVRDASDRIFVSSSQDINRRLPQIANAKSLGAGYSTTIISLQYIGAADMAEILKPMADENAFVRVDSTRNLLMMAGTRKQMEGWLDIVATFDVDMLKGMSVGIFPLENSSVSDIEEALSGLVGQPASAGGKDASALAGAIGSVVKVIPVERLNSILVITPRAHYLETIRTWIERLDRSPSDSLEKRLHVYPVQNTSSGHLAELLSSVYSGSTSGTKSKDSGVAPGLVKESVTSDGKESSSASSNQKASTASKVNVQLGDSTSIVADEDNNALLIYATGKEYKKIESALKKLDVVPAQVLIEASILEVTLTDDFKFGVEWAFSNGIGGGDRGTAQLGTSENAIAAILPGFSYTVANSAGNIEAVLNALAEKSLLNVISTPSVMVLDNNTATIQVGDQQPVRTGQSVSTDGNVLTSSIEYKDTGVKLAVTPSVNAGGLVTMSVEQSVTDVGTVDSATGQRSFNKRDINSRVAVRSGESVVLGGLIRENKTNSKSGVPGLHEIPVFGGLFGKTTDTGRRTELLIVITPKVLLNEEDLRSVSREMRSRIRGLELISPAITSEKSMR
ncbi:type II secretion system secretin GspD [Neptunomonas concharum]|uniref:Type II secretion system protein GspD n=1 Tax=Neptunomonas concharum TaxID=1031538 RepID=A0A5P1R982_9GAMM|nr:type II secretion system secretin GspD [Neptunomonas concharum]QEQ95845.1 type II secretion system protein GspD [Neptunomonas concharum]